jgi:hypothetical protein
MLWGWFCHAVAWQIDGYKTTGYDTHNHLARDESGMKSILLVCIMFLLAPLHAGAWSLFGPKTYEECIQANMKGIASDKAAAAVEEACYVQFQEAKDNAKAAAIEEKKRNRQMQCGLTADIWKYRKTFSIDQANLSVTETTLGNIKNLSLDRNTMQLSLQNNNSFGISYLQIGFIKGKTCPSRISDFESTIACSTNSTNTGVQQKSFGTLACTGATNKDKNLPFCLTSYSPRYDQFNDQLLDFMEYHGYCSGN